MLLGQQIDKFLIKESLGKGQFGEVYLVLDRVVNCDKAIKVLDVNHPNDFISHFKEAQILEKCRHKHIIGMITAEVISVGGSPKVFIEMEYVKQGSIDKGLKEGRFFPPASSIACVRHALYGLEHAHHNGILHRDIKPGNILLAGATGKLSDFGQAEFAPSGQINAGFAYTSHKAPEVMNSGITSVQSDIFATGVTLFRVVNHITEWSASVASLPNLPSVLQKGILIKQIGFESYVPDCLQRVIRKACNPDPAKRYQSAREFANALEKLRINRNWSRTTPFEWVCMQNGSEFKAECVGKRVVVTKNGRRILDLCMVLESEAAARLALNKYVAQDSFK